MSCGSELIGEIQAVLVCGCSTQYWWGLLLKIYIVYWFGSGRKGTGIWWCCHMLALVMEIISLWIIIDNCFYFCHGPAFYTDTIYWGILEPPHKVHPPIRFLSLLVLLTDHDDVAGWLFEYSCVVIPLNLSYFSCHVEKIIKRNEDLVWRDHISCCTISNTSPLSPRGSLQLVVMTTTSFRHAQCSIFSKVLAY